MLSALDTNCSVDRDAQNESRQPLRATASMDSGEDRNRTPLENTGNTGVSDQSGAESGALGAREALIDPGLVAVVDAWPALPAAIKEGIVAMVRAAR